MKKYTFYAIGEIALVVIGILIALQINNWNEERKNRKAEDEALVNLKQEFDQNYGYLVYLLEKRKTQEKSFRDLINLLTDPTIPIPENDSIWQINLNTASWAAKNTVLNSLVNTGGINRIQNESLKSLLTKWPDYVDNFKNGEVRFEESVKNYENYTNSVIPRSVVKVGNYKGTWPGNYYPHNVAEKLKPIRVKLKNDVMYYNLIAQLTTSIYIYSMTGTHLKDNYKQIAELINEEIVNRGIVIPDK
jgi:hypothetical protein